MLKLIDRFDLWEPGQRLPPAHLGDMRGRDFDGAGGEKPAEESISCRLPCVAMAMGGRWIVMIRILMAMRCPLSARQ